MKIKYPTSMASDIFKDILSFLAKKGLDGVSFENVLNHLYELNHFTINQYNNIIIDGQFVTPNLEYFDSNSTNTLQIELLSQKVNLIVNVLDEIATKTKGRLGSESYTIKFEYYAYLTEIDELELARTNAKQARTFSFIAIGISILSIFASIGFNMWGSSKIDEEQIDSLQQTIENSTYSDKNIIEELQKTNSRLDSLISNP